MSARSFVLAGVAVLVWALPATSATVLPITFPELVSESTSIIRGEVVAIRSEWRDATEASPIVTRVTVRVDQVLKGPQQSQLELMFLGGKIGDVELRLSDMPDFVVGERDYLFLANEAARSASPLVGFFVGRWAIHTDAFTHREFVTTAGGRVLTDVADVDSRGGSSLSTMRRPASGPLSMADLESRIREQVRR